jgi:hypothetical protein
MGRNRGGKIMNGITLAVIVILTLLCGYLKVRLDDMSDKRDNWRQTAMELNRKVMELN